MNRIFRLAKPMLIAGVVVGSSLPLIARAEPAPADEKAPATQPARDGEGRRGPRMMGGGGRRLLNGIELGADQKKKIDSILEKSREDGRALWEKTKDLDPTERREQFREHMKGVHEQIAAELNEGQRKTFEENVAKSRERMRAAGEGPATRPAAMLDRLKESIAKLELSDEQKAKVESLMADTRDKLQKLREETKEATEATREKFGEVMRASRDQLREILTPEQREKLREMMGRPGGEGGADKKADKKQDGV